MQMQEKEQSSCGNIFVASVFISNRSVVVLENVQQSKADVASGMNNNSNSNGKRGI